MSAHGSAKKLAHRRVAPPPKIARVTTVAAKDAERAKDKWSQTAGSSEISTEDRRKIQATLLWSGDHAGSNDGDARESVVRIICVPK